MEFALSDVVPTQICQNRFIHVTNCLPSISRRAIQLRKCRAACSSCERESKLLRERQQAARERASCERESKRAALARERASCESKLRAASYEIAVRCKRALFLISCKNAVHCESKLREAARATFEEQFARECTICSRECTFCSFSRSLRESAPSLAACERVHLLLQRVHLLLLLSQLARECTF